MGCVLLHVNVSVSEKGNFHRFPLYFITEFVFQRQRQISGQDCAIFSEVHVYTDLFMFQYVSRGKCKAINRFNSLQWALSTVCIQLHRLHLTVKADQEIYFKFFSSDCDHQASVFSVEPDVFMSCCVCITYFLHKRKRSSLHFYFLLCTKITLQTWLYL